MHQQANVIVISAFILLLCLASLGHTQQNAGTSQKAFSAGAFIGAIHFIDPSVTSTMIGGYGYRAYNRLLVGGEGAGIIGNRDRSSGGHGLFMVGYAVFTRKAWHTYPYVGFGGGRFTVDNQSDRGVLLGVGLGTDVIASSIKTGRGITVGSRVGYLFRFDNTNLNAVYLTLSFGGMDKEKNTKNTNH